MPRTTSTSSTADPVRRPRLAIVVKSPMNAFYVRRDAHLQHLPSPPSSLLCHFLAGYHSTALLKFNLSCCLAVIRISASNRLLAINLVSCSYRCPSCHVFIFPPPLIASQAAQSPLTALCLSYLLSPVFVTRHISRRRDYPRHIIITEGRADDSQKGRGCLRWADGLKNAHWQTHQQAGRTLLSRALCSATQGSL